MYTCSYSMYQKCKSAKVTEEMQICISLIPSTVYNFSAHFYEVLLLGYHFGTFLNWQFLVKCFFERYDKFLVTLLPPDTS